MPAVVRTRRGEALAELGSGPVRVYEWVEVGMPERRLEPEVVGELVASIHRVEVPAAGPVDPWYVAPVGEPAWRDLVRRLREARAPFVDRLEAVVPEVLDAEALLVATEAVQTCHRDLWADNILRTPADGLVVLDWENSGPLIPRASSAWCCSSSAWAIPAGCATCSHRTSPRAGRRDSTSPATSPC
jgi:Ser/Thr protein kinase RdoA (MazF antagonist)